MIGGLGDVGKIPELRKRIVFSILMLAVYRLGVFVSTPGVDVAALRRLFGAAQGTLFGLINMFSGGSFENFSIFTLGVAPYISVSIIMEILAHSIPALSALKKEGDAGRRVLTRYKRQGTIALALFQSYMIAIGLENQGLVVQPGAIFRVSTMFTLTAGTAFIMWLGEQITERGIGNGISVIIFAGIVARMPRDFVQLLKLAQTGEIQPLSVLMVLLFSVLTVAFIVFVERAHRKIPVQYPRRMVGKHQAAAQTQHMPLKLNMAGVIPPIFASALLVIPATIAQFSTNPTLLEYLGFLTPGSWVYYVVFTALVVCFGFFYTSIIFNPEEVAENLKKNGGFIPTVRPGKPTAEYLEGVLTRLTLWGSVYIAIVCVVPQLFFVAMGASQFAFTFGGTAALIAVGVTLDTASQIESMVVARNYEAFMSATVKKRGGLGSFSYHRSRLLRR